MKLKLAESDNELQQILELQNANHYNNVSSTLQKSDGFVTVSHDFDLLSNMNKKAKQIIAVDNGKVIGYALVMLKEFKNMIPVLIPMFDMFQNIAYHDIKLDDLNYYVMGQVCIAQEYRGKGIFKSLYQKHKEVYSPQFELCLTEVASNNLRSMKAHQKIGFKILHTYSDTTNEWNILSWDWK
ncbi:GNAT family N-acetyltransferase [Aquimarina rhabdastrellae]